MSLPRYPRYKDSGVEWLGQVPEHWEVISIKWLSPVKRGASPRPIDDPKYFDDEGEFAWVRIADVSACDSELKQTTQRLSELGSSLSVKIAPGELFVSIAGTVGKPCISAIKACIHDGFVYFPTLKLDPLFLYRVFEGGVCYGGLGKWGTQLNLNTDTIGSIRVAIPPAAELKKVLDFLDRETSKIDALIAEQERLIELLKEKRQAVISHAVTKGLDPNVPLKDSGIEWLGMVPEHWELRKISQLFRAAKGKYGQILTKEFCAENPGSYAVYSGQTENEGLMGTWDQFEFDFPVEGVLFSTTVGSGKVMSLRHIFGKFSLSQNCMIIWPRDHSCRTRFYYYHFQPLFDYERNLIPQHMQASFRMEDLYSYRIATPPEEEQLGISNFLDTETARFDALTAEAERAIELLHERRSALISAAVTGQFDVRSTVNN